ncbi:hypothetical protein L1987_85331 [Smallanthus sonchifolius]|uniref:Uncharacterized protein n=1 Tax=Smallanthus sonchifolius TaxID=185202 RepID=A0ACB8XXU4_9ASTR|nr:hypothetical protein L1987_85331 [Smallanthus sonchifolius]
MGCPKRRVSALLLSRAPLLHDLLRHRVSAPLFQDLLQHTPFDLTLHCTYRAHDNIDEITAAFSFGFNPTGTKF